MEVRLIRQPLFIVKLPLPLLLVANTFIVHGTPSAKIKHCCQVTYTVHISEVNIQSIRVNRFSWVSFIYTEQFCGSNVVSECDSVVSCV